MNAIVIEHVPVAELAQAWRAKFAQTTNARVTARAKEEQLVATTPVEEFVADDPLFGPGRDRADRMDLAGYVRSMRDLAGARWPSQGRSRAAEEGPGIAQHRHRARRAGRSAPRGHLSDRRCIQ